MIRRLPSAVLFPLLLGVAACGSDGGDAAADAGGADVLADATAGDAGGDGTSADTAEEDFGVSLVEAPLWTLAAPEDDPFVARAPAEPRCVDGAWYVDIDLIEIDTGKCDYATLVQPLAADLAPGDEVEIIAWNGRLAAPEVAMAHIDVRIGDALVWGEEVPIPSEGGFYTPRLAVTAAAPAGTPVYFHVDNHGFNTWNLVKISRFR